jgi:hypothetical protein
MGVSWSVLVSVSLSSLVNMGVISKSRQIALKFRSLLRQYYHLADGFGPRAINDCRPKIFNIGFGVGCDLSHGY